MGFHVSFHDHLYSMMLMIREHGMRGFGGYVGLVKKHMIFNHVVVNITVLYVKFVIFAYIMHVKVL